jgi:hypothetical protein
MTLEAMAPLSEIPGSSCPRRPPDQTGQTQPESAIDYRRCYTTNGDTIVDQHGRVAVDPNGHPVRLDLSPSEAHVEHS